MLLLIFIVVILLIAGALATVLYKRTIEGALSVFAPLASNLVSFQILYFMVFFVTMSVVVWFCLNLIRVQLSHLIPTESLTNAEFVSTTKPISGALPTRAINIEETSQMLTAEAWPDKATKTALAATELAATGTAEAMLAATIEAGVHETLTAQAVLEVIPTETLLPPTPTPLPTNTPTPVPTPFAQTIRDTTLLRAGPGDNYPVMAEISAGPKLAVEGRTTNSRWLRVCCIAASALWVDATHVEISNDVTTALEVSPPPSPTPSKTQTPIPLPSLTPTPSPTPLMSMLMNRAMVSASSTAPDGKDTCTPPSITSFAANNLIDGDDSTAWRVAGSATDDYIDFRFDRPVILQEMRIVPGYAKTDPCDRALYWCPINRIPKRVQLTFDGKVKVEFVLEERCEQQRVTWQPLTVQSVRLEILETYPPSNPRTQRDFTPISEVEFWGYQP